MRYRNLEFDEVTCLHLIQNLLALSDLEGAEQLQQETVKVCTGILALSR